jgi:hypothetical protein
VEGICEKETCIWHSNMYGSVYCGGFYYIQIFDEVHRLTQTGLELVDKIPELDLKESASFYGKIFSMNNNLYCSNGYKIYELGDSVFNYVQSFEWGFYFSFCGTCIVWHPQKDIMILKPDLTMQLLCETDNTCNWFVLN